MYKFNYCYKKLIKVWKSEQNYPHAVSNFVDNCINKCFAVDKFVGIWDGGFENYVTDIMNFQKIRWNAYKSDVKKMHTL